MAGINHLYISRGHNFFGHYGRDAGTHAMDECEEVRCVAGQGIEGDRFFGFKENYRGQITLFADEVYGALCRRFEVWDRPPSVFRRNVVTRGVDLNALIGRRFGIGEVTLEGTEECRPCEWMDRAFHAGAEEALRGQGGLRARILSDGVLRAGLAEFHEI